MATTQVLVHWRDIRSEYFDPRLRGDALEELRIQMDAEVREAVENASAFDKLAEWALAQMVAQESAGIFVDGAGDEVSRTQGGPRREDLPFDQVVIENFGTGDLFRLRLNLRGDELTCERIPG